MSNLNPQTTTSLSNLIMSYYEKRLLDRLLVKFHFEKFAMKAKLSKNSGKTITWNRFANVSDSVTALTESVSPNGITLSTTQIAATVAGYGQYAATNDFLNLTAINDMMSQMVDLLGYAAGKSMDALVRNEIDANATAVYSNNATSEGDTGSDDTMSSAAIRKAVKTLRAADVDEFEDGLFRAIIHPYQEFDLLGESSANTLIQLVSLTDRAIAERGQIGTGWGVKFFRSSHVRAVTSNVYRALVTGVDAYGTVDLESAGLRIITKQLGSAGTEDPLDQRATVGYKFYFATKTLDANRAISLRTYGA